MIDDPAKYVFDLGQLHDAWLVEVRWNAKNKTMMLEFDNYRASVAPDESPWVNGVVEFAEVSQVRGALSDLDMMVSDFSIAAGQYRWEANLVMKSGASLQWTFRKMSAVERQS